MKSPKTRLLNLLLLFFSLSWVMSIQAVETENADLINQIVALVNNKVITQSELEKEMLVIKNQLRAQRTPMPPDELLVKQVLDKLILQSIQLQQADQRHIRVSDEALNSEISRIAGSNGLDISSLRQALERDGIPFPEYRERLRKEIIIFQLQQRMVVSKVTITEQEIENFVNNQTLQGGGAAIEYRLGHILIVIPESATANEIQMAKSDALDVIDELKSGKEFAEVAIARSGGQQALQGGDLGWRKLSEMPTLFSDRVSKMEVGDSSEPIRSPSGFHIIKLLETRSNEKQHFVNQTKARHILIKPSNILSPEGAKDKIIDLKLQINSGGDFAALAKEFSDDKGSAVDGGDLGWVNPGVMVPAFESAMNQLEPGEMSEPIRTQFGWHLIQVLDHRRLDNTEEFKKNQVTNMLKQQKVQPALENWLRRLRDEAFVEMRV